MVTHSIDFKLQQHATKNASDSQIQGRVITCKVVGVSYEHRQEVVAKLKMGDQIWLEREEHNPFDGNAVRVIRNSGEQIGYINRNLAMTVAPVMDRLGQPIEGRVYLLTGGSWGDYSLGVIIAFKLPSLHEILQKHHLTDWDDDERGE